MICVFSWASFIQIPQAESITSARSREVCGKVYLIAVSARSREVCKPAVGVTCLDVSEWLNFHVKFSDSVISMQIFEVKFQIG